MHGSVVDVKRMYGGTMRVAVQENVAAVLTNRGFNRNLVYVGDLFFHRRVASLALLTRLARESNALFEWLGNVSSRPVVPVSPDAIEMLRRAGYLEDSEEQPPG